MLDFPNNPVDGDTWTDPNGVAWRFNGYGWKEYDPPPLQSLYDISNIIPSIGDKLIWDGTKFEIQQQTAINLNDLTDITPPTTIGEYLIWGGDGWVPTVKSTDIIHAHLQLNDDALITVNNNESPGDEYIFKDVIQDTDGMTGILKNRITFTKSGLYVIIGSSNTRNVKVLTDNKDHWFWLILKTYNKIGGLKNEYRNLVLAENQNPSVFNPSLIIPYKFHSLMVYDNFDVGDYTTLGWEDDLLQLMEQYTTHVSFSVLRIGNKV